MGSRGSHRATRQLRLVSEFPKARFVDVVEEAELDSFGLLNLVPGSLADHRSPASGGGVEGVLVLTSGGVDRVARELLQRRLMRMRSR